jgi:hypothetical protein
MEASACTWQRRAAVLAQQLVAPQACSSSAQGGAGDRGGAVVIVGGAVLDVQARRGAEQAVHVHVCARALSARRAIMVPSQ